MVKGVMPCGHPPDALEWDDIVKKEVCSACRAEVIRTSYIARAFAAQEQQEHVGEVRSTDSKRSNEESDS